MTRNTWTMRKGDLLNLDNNAKTAKGRKYGIATAIMYLAPSDVSGYQTCPMASAGCKIACLNTAGRGRMNMIQQARINRTRRFFEQRAEFMLQLEREIVGFLALCERDGFKPAIRLNGTSDLKWERIGFTSADGEVYRSMMERFPNVTFYDYTKIPIRYRENRPSNYHLTFSLAENNDSDAIEALKAGVNVAAVFHTLPDAYHWTSSKYGLGGFTADVIPGDITDTRFNDARGVIVGLTAKGAAKQDRTGFVR
jgi:hypothetical protein